MATVTLPDGFHFDEADGNLTGKPKSPGRRAPDPPLGVLSNFRGTFVGKGFNLIFRPNSVAPTTTEFPNPVSPPPPQVPSEQLLELNLTTETLAFSAPLGSVPNRGLINQNDIFLNGVSYVQTVNDVTNPLTGKGDADPVNIHFEPGLWMHIPETKTDPIVGESLCRMASIPHGTTINAEGLAPTDEPTFPGTFPGPPQFQVVDISPFPIGGSNKIRFKAQTAADTVTPRLPQDLTKFIEAGTITQDILNNPNLVLSNAIKGQNITKTIVFQVTTAPNPTEVGEGTANINFLKGTNGSDANADAALMTAIFWIETVEYELVVPAYKLGDPALHLTPAAPSPDAVLPTFRVKPPRDITSPTTIKAEVTQIQYSQNVNLNFAGLTWPHVSVATLVPDGLVRVPSSVFD